MRGPSRSAVAAVLYLIVAGLVGSQIGTWTDEEYTLATTAHGPAFAFHQALAYELQAPLYFVLEALWRSIDGSVFWARIPSLLCVAALFFTFARIARRIAPTVDPLWFALVATLNPYVVYAGFEIRLYAFALLLASIMWLTFEAGFVAGSRTSARVLFVFTSITAVCVQYFLAFSLVAFAVVLLVRRDRRALLAYAAACIPIALAVLPLALLARTQMSGYETHGPVLAYLLRHSALHPWLDFIFPYERDWDVVRAVHPLYDGVIAAAIFSFVAAQPRLQRSDYAWIAGAVTIQCIYLALVATVRLPLDDRHYVALYVPLAAAWYALAVRIRESPRPRVTWVFAWPAILTVAVLFSEYRHLAQPGDWRRVGAYLATHVRSGDKIVVYAADAAAPLERTYHGRAPVVPFPRTPSPNVYSVDALTVHSSAQVARAFARLAPYRQLWFVSSVRCRADEESYGCVYVQPTIDRTFTLLDERWFYETRVEELSPVERAGGQQSPQTVHD